MNQTRRQRGRALQAVIVPALAKAGSPLHSASKEGLYQLIKDRIAATFGTTTVNLASVDATDYERALRYAHAAGQLVYHHSVVPGDDGVYGRMQSVYPFKV